MIFRAHWGSRGSSEYLSRGTGSHTYQGSREAKQHLPASSTALLLSVPRAKLSRGGRARLFLCARRNRHSFGSNGGMRTLQLTLWFIYKFIFLSFSFSTILSLLPLLRPQHCECHCWESSLVALSLRAVPVKERVNDQGNGQLVWRVKARGKGVI